MSRYLRTALMVAALAATPAIAYDLKGIELGQVATHEQLQSQLGIDPECAESSYLCVGVTKLEGISVVTKVVFGTGRIVSQIFVEFEPEQFEALSQAAIRKWGKPATHKAPMQNAFGAVVDNVELDWVQPDGQSVSVFKYMDLEHGGMRLWIESRPSKPADSPM